jgi:electron transfer flavoprotein alpha subunit
MTALLILMETDGGRILESTLPSVKFAQDLARLWETEFDLLAVGGAQIGQETEEWRHYGAHRIWCAADTGFEHPTADRVAFACQHAMTRSGATTLIGGATTFGKDVLPRVAEIRGLPMISDVLGFGRDTAGLQFLRAMYAGNVLATVELDSRPGVFSVRPAAFRDPARHDDASELEPLTFESTTLPSGTEWCGLAAAARQRPELTSARAVVSGGRPLRDAATFEKLLGGLADALHGAVGATRAAVDSGIAPNELQVGQTGKVVAPDLYIAAGVSGSVQHLAGMKDSRVIVAINTDPDAPIFAVADYGLVADLYQAVPELTEAVNAENQKQR